jgi:hypothetical protein
MNSYNCYQCNKSINEAINMSICFICERIICINCNHTHNTYVNDKDDNLKSIIKHKGDIAYNSMMNFFEFDKFGYPIRIDNYYNDYFDDIDINREVIKRCILLKCHGIDDYRTFYDDLLKIKIKFKYGLYKMLLLKIFCVDITEIILRYL